jgi:hypothetical protein
MRRCLLALSFCLLLTGVWVLARPSCPGTLAPNGEAEHAMGAQCYDTSTVKTTVCYNSTCMPAGCGCVEIQNFIPGSFQLKSPQPCQSSLNCKAILDISTRNCATGS